MNHKIAGVIVLAGAAWLVGLPGVEAAGMRERVDAAVRILGAKQSSRYAIPQEVLDEAKGVAIVRVTKAGLVLGGSGGQGVMVKRLKTTLGLGKKWSAPSAFDITGGSFGAQIGFESRDLILVLNSDEMVRMFSSRDTVKWDATARGIADDRSAEESKSDMQKLPIRIYAYSKGLYGGATLGGTSITANWDVNYQAYGEHTIQDILDGKVKAPDYSEKLYKLLK